MKNKMSLTEIHSFRFQSFVCLDENVVVNFFEEFKSAIAWTIWRDSKILNKNSVYFEY